MAEKEQTDCISGFKFALDLMKFCTKGSSENVFVSPFSISVALGMTLAGAKGMTADQMKNALKLDSIGDDAAIHESYKSGLDSLSAVQDLAIKLHVANRMYVRDKANLLSEFREILKNKYSASSAEVDFANNSEKIRLEINKWVEEVTVNKIKDLVSPGMLNADTCVVLINAVYFKGDWAEKFDPQKTKTKEFFVDDSTTIAIDMMYIKDKFPYARNEELKCQILELPYVNKNLSMFIILPNEKFGLKQLEEKLADENLNTLLSSMHKRKVDVNIPKFKVETSLSLVDTLRAMGMRDIFEGGKADLSGINGSKNLFVSEIAHKAFLEVNEEGSEAAAATASMIMTLSASLDPGFYADHPFILFIRDNSTGIILFWGRINNPS